MRNLVKSGPKSSLILLIFIFAITFASDRWIPNSRLSLPLISAALISSIITKLTIPKLNILRCNQIIRKEGPKEHHNKSGTPTLGGILIVPIGLIIGSLITLNPNNSGQIISICLVTLAYMIIGGIDDLKSLSKKTNTGLTAQKKILLQTAVAMIFLFWTGWQGWINPEISLPFGNSINAGLLIWPLALFVFLAESNSTNLTDGLDGLASGCGALVLTGLAIQLLLRGENGNPVLAGLCMSMAGAWAGFLTHNRNPAKIFMGDTGSLAMGAFLSGVAILSNSLWPLLVMGGVFLMESLSVILQVTVFKITKQINGQGTRILRMAPLHHHFELNGMNEQVIVNSFWLLTIIFVLISLLIYPIY